MQVPLKSCVVMIVWMYSTNRFLSNTDFPWMIVKSYAQGIIRSNQERILFHWLLKIKFKGPKFSLTPPLFFNKIDDFYIRISLIRWSLIMHAYREQHESVLYMQSSLSAYNVVLHWIHLTLCSLNLIGRIPGSNLFAAVKLLNLVYAWHMSKLLVLYLYISTLEQ